MISLPSLPAAHCPHCAGGSGTCVCLRCERGLEAQCKRQHCVHCRGLDDICGCQDGCKKASYVICRWPPLSKEVSSAVTASLQKQECTYVSCGSALQKQYFVRCMRYVDSRSRDQPSPSPCLSGSSSLPSRSASHHPHSRNCLPLMTAFLYPLGFTCFQGENQGCCLVCAEKCHKGHDLSSPVHSRSF